jgi:integrase
VDLEARRLHVRQSLFWQKTPGSKRGNGHWIEAPTKTKSTRTLPLFGPVLEAVARQVARRQAEGRGEYLFASSTFAPINASSINKAWKVACQRAKVPVIRFHDARHSTGSMLHAAGASPFTIMEVLGHSQISTTKRYTHTPVAVLEDALTKVGNAVEEAAKRLPTEQESNRVAVSVAVN